MKKFRPLAVAAPFILAHALAPVAHADITIETVALTGDQAPGAASGVVFTSFDEVSLNAAGQTVFEGLLTGTGVTDSNDLGIYSEGTGTLRNVARTGDQAPDAAVGVVFRGFVDLVLNAAGQTVFQGFLTGTGVDSSNDGGIYSEGTGILREVAREGGQAPDAAVGVLFGSFTGFSTSGPSLNATGQTAFTATLTGTGVDSSNHEGLYATDPEGTLVKIIRDGDLLDVNDDPLINDLRTVRTVSSISVLPFGSGNEDGRQSYLNDLGQIAFLADFTDGTSGVFIANTVPASCPQDLTGDGSIDSEDLGALLAAWGSPGPADFDGSGTVDSADLGILLAAWGACP